MYIALEIELMQNNRCRTCNIKAKRCLIHTVKLSKVPVSFSVAHAAAFRAVADWVACEQQQQVVLTHSSIRIVYASTLHVINIGIHQLCRENESKQFAVAARDLLCSSELQLAAVEN